LVGRFRGGTAAAPLPIRKKGEMTARGEREGGGNQLARRKKRKEKKRRKKERKEGKRGARSGRELRGMMNRFY
jgi:hypothetical protein